jgi:hypothetical protein
MVRPRLMIQILFDQPIPGIQLQDPSVSEDSNSSQR